MLEQEIGQAFREAPAKDRHTRVIKEGRLVAVIRRDDKSEVRASIETVNRNPALLIRVWVPGFDDATLKPVSWMAIKAEEIPSILQAVTAAAASIGHHTWAPGLQIHPTPGPALAPGYTSQEIRP